ncbi:MAG TPA: phosphatase PAP2 family protein [Gammaproteobacteria bacterium]|nr:phosphatase PAP2 family protein [Gammaproteobacteria bacterium]
MPFLPSTRSRTAAARAEVKRSSTRARLTRALATLALAAAAAFVAAGAHAQADGPEPEQDADAASGLGGEIKAYVTAPLHAGRRQWVGFGVAVGAIAFAHHFDEDARNHIGPGPSIPTEPPDTHDSGDAVPAALMLGGTWAAAVMLDDDDGRHEAGTMLEAAAFSSVAGYALKEVAGRERPYVSADPNNWRTGGDSFPSLHATAAFAIGTVFAESGNDYYRWLRRVVGYGIAAGTAYQRIKHDAHWFSDTVAGASLGVATARFTMRRDDEAENRRARLTIEPGPAGLVLSYTVALR